MCYCAVRIECRILGMYKQANISLDCKNLKEEHHLVCCPAPPPQVVPYLK